MIDLLSVAQIHKPSLRATPVSATLNSRILAKITTLGPSSIFPLLRMAGTRLAAASVLAPLPPEITGPTHPHYLFHRTLLGCTHLRL